MLVYSTDFPCDNIDPVEIIESIDSIISSEHVKVVLVAGERRAGPGCW